MIPYIGCNLSNCRKEKNLTGKKQKFLKYWQVQYSLFRHAKKISHMHCITQS